MANVEFEEFHSKNKAFIQCFCRVLSFGMKLDLSNIMKRSIFKCLFFAFNTRVSCKCGVLSQPSLRLKQLQLCAMSPSAYSHSDADVLNQSLLEANIATEVCLTVLDTLSVFIMGFKVMLQNPCRNRRTVTSLESLFDFYFFSDETPRRPSCARTMDTAR